MCTATSTAPTALPPLDDAAFEHRLGQTLEEVLPAYLDAQDPVGIALTAFGVALVVRPAGRRAA